MHYLSVCALQCSFIVISHVNYGSICHKPAVFNYLMKCKLFQSLSILQIETRTNLYFDYQQRSSTKWTNGHLIDHENAWRYRQIAGNAKSGVYTDVMRSKYESTIGELQIMINIAYPSDFTIDLISQFCYKNMAINLVRLPGYRPISITAVISLSLYVYHIGEAQVNLT